jgi:biopolymer transport protein ExbD
VFQQLRAIIVASFTIASCSTVASDDCPKYYTTHISQSNDVSVSGKQLAIDEFSILADMWFSTCPKAKISVIADARSTTRFLVEVVNLVRKAGFSDVLVSTEDAK